MVTINMFGSKNNMNACELYGLSTDEKPTKDEYGNSLVNGSIFIEIDTATGYLWDAANETWCKVE